MRAILIVVAAALAGCAHAPPSPTAAAPPETRIVTGSHVPQAVDPQTGVPARSTWVRTYGGGDLSASGQTNVGAALKKLEPADY
ncbi:MAG TPA: hypothetical protein VMT17_19095 [Anaeromyxobacteraceae bacterium]|nr:hypothetical protein [Anaeromyxobacteraceae bacterium]